MVGVYGFSSLGSPELSGLYRQKEIKKERQKERKKERKKEKKKKEGKKKDNKVFVLLELN